MNNYFFIDSTGKQFGPVIGDSLKLYGVTRNTLVWCPGMSGWEKAGVVYELRHLFVEEKRESVPRAYNSYAYSLPPNDHLIWAVLITIFCCLPFGIVAIVKSSDVERLWHMGMREEAIAKSRSVKKWCWAGFACGAAHVVLAVLWTLLGLGVYMFATMLTWFSFLI